MANNPVAVFDSGIGSLSIIRELRHEIPYEDLLYFADRVHFPYGTKSHSELREIIVNTINYLKRYNPKLVVVASSTHLPFVKRYLNSLLPTVRFIDPAQIVAKDVRKFLAFYRMAKKSGRSNLRILVSDGKREFEKSVRALGVREPIEEVFLTF